MEAESLLCTLEELEWKKKINWKYVTISLVFLTYKTKFTRKQSEFFVSYTWKIDISFHLLTVLAYISTRQNVMELRNIFDLLVFGSCSPHILSIT